jgi:hypothetical protein
VLSRRTKNNPILIGEVFQTTLQPFPLEIEQKIELFRLFESEVVSKLESMYVSLNEILIAAGIMPTIVLKTSRHVEEEDEPEISIRQAKYENTQNNVAQYGIPRTAQEISYLASQFMSGDYTAPKSAVNLPESFKRPVSKQSADGKKYYERKDVVKALSRLQNKIINGEGETQDNSIEQIKRTLFTDMAAAEGGIATRQVNTLDERSIDFVGMMFDAITQDESIAVVIKNLLLRLQIPVIKVAMSDTGLFEQENHPTSEVLDLITEAGKGVNDEADRVYSDLENVVDHLLEQYDVDIESFNQAADELHQIIDTELKLTQENELREQKQIIFTNAREIIVDEVRHITSHKKIPQNVMPLITKNWPSLMINRYVQHGKESWEWLESVMLMKLMIKCLQPIQNSSQWRTVWHNHIALVDAVEDELSTTKQEQSLVHAQTEMLKQTFLDLLDAYGYKMVEDARVTSATMFKDADADKDAELAASNLQAANDDNAEQYDDEDLRSTHIADVAELAKAKINKLPSNVHPGVWFEIFNGEDRAIRRLKLSVVLTEVAKLVFVDRKGVKIIEKDAGDFAAELDKNKSRFIADHSTFEHALGQVIGSIAA